MEDAKIRGILAFYLFIFESYTKSKQKLSAKFTKLAIRERQTLSNSTRPRRLLSVTSGKEETIEKVCENFCDIYLSKLGPYSQIIHTKNHRYMVFNLYNIYAIF